MYSKLTKCFKLNNIKQSISCKLASNKNPVSNKVNFHIKHFSKYFSRLHPPPDMVLPDLPGVHPRPEDREVGGEEQVEVWKRGRVEKVRAESSLQGCPLLVLKSTSVCFITRLSPTCTENYERLFYYKVVTLLVLKTTSVCFITRLSPYFLLRMGVYPKFVHKKHFLLFLIIKQYKLIKVFVCAVFLQISLLIFLSFLQFNIY